jgi:hypothetical protein
MTGAEMTHIAYKGGGQATVDLISGQMAAYLKSEIDKYGKSVRELGLKID